MTEYSIPEGHQLRERYIKDVLDRLREISKITRTVNAEVENMIQSIQEGNWDHASETLHETYPLLNGAADKCLTAANFAVSLEQKAT